MIQSYLGDNLYELRKQKGISQDEFAENLGVSRQAVSKWERNEAYPDTENLIAISRFYGVTIDDLINKPLSEVEAASVDEPQIELLEDTEADGGNQNMPDNKSEKSEWYYVLRSVPYPVVITVIYMLLGFFAPRGWEIGWTLYVTIPIYYSIIGCFRSKKLSSFAYPVFVTFVFLLFGIDYKTNIVYNGWE